MENAVKAPLFHYYLIAGQVMFADDQGQTHAIFQNAMVQEEKQVFGLYQIVKAQQGLQQTLFNKLGGPVEVADVIITNVNYLGAYTKEQFDRMPANMSLREMRNEQGEPSINVEMVNTNEVVATDNVVELKVNQDGEA